MEIEDFFQKRRKYQGDRDNGGYYEKNMKTHDSRYPYYVNDNRHNLPDLLYKLKNNKKLRLLLLFAVIIIISIVVGLIIVLLPLIMNLISYVSQNGLQGLFEYIAGFLDKIWKGSAQ
jgi:hypothetical protein